MGIVESFFLIFVSAAVVAALALFARQPFIVAYIAVGCVLGPHGLALASDAELLGDIGEFGIIFLLFLVGLDLPPAKLKNLFGASIVTAILSSAIFFAIGFGVLWLFAYGFIECVVAGIAAMFSSTILGIKLLPTTVLHHRHIGEIVISLLLIQDLIAILALIALASAAGGAVSAADLGMIAVALPAVVVAAFAGVRLAVLPLLRRFDVFQEFIFLLTIGWCLGIAMLAHALGLSLAIGAFVAGVALATSPIAQYITQNLKPLRDFFLILFFFSVGAEVDPSILGSVAVPAVLMAVLLVAVKPVVFRVLLVLQNEEPQTAWEVGVRLGQTSEFSLLVTYVAAGLLTAESAHAIQAATVLTLVLSTYLVIFRYPSPIAVSRALRRD